VVSWVVMPHSLYVGTDIFEEHPASIFRVEACWYSNYFDHIRRLQRKWIWGPRVRLRKSSLVPVCLYDHCNYWTYMLQPWKWMRHVFLICWYPPRSLLIITTMNNSKLTNNTAQTHSHSLFLDLMRLLI
jgi:hypothetical protein